MRHIYELTQETIDVFTGNVKQIAVEMEVSDKYVYGILADEKTDSFARFKSDYAACVRAGADVTPYDAALSSVKARYASQKPKTLLDCLSAKSQTESGTLGCILKAIQDGEIDDKEREAIGRFIEKERQDLDLIEISLNFGGMRGDEVVRRMRRK